MGGLPRAQALTFFRDVTTLQTLLAVLVGQTLTMAPLLPSVVAELGAAELVEFGGHLAMLALYTGLHSASTALAAGAEEEGKDDHDEGHVVVVVESPPPPVSVEEFRRACRRDAWAYGSGLDS